jgi:hypothetical protein
MGMRPGLASLGSTTYTNKRQVHAPRFAFDCVLYPLRERRLVRRMKDVACSILVVCRMRLSRRFQQARPIEHTRECTCQQSLIVVQASLGPVNGKWKVLFTLLLPDSPTTNDKLFIVLHFV